MKKKSLLPYLFSLFVFISISSSAQLNAEPLRLTSYAEIMNRYEIKPVEIDSVKSILFVFKGKGDDYLSAYYFLSNKLIRRWNKKVEFGFQYNLRYKKEVAPKWMQLPTYQNTLTEPDLRVEIRSNKFKTKIFHANYEDSYLVDVSVIDPKTNDLLEYAQLRTVNRRERVYRSWAISKLIDILLEETDAPKNKSVGEKP